MCILDPVVYGVYIYAKLFFVQSYHRSFVVTVSEKNQQHNHGEQIYSALNGSSVRVGLYQVF